MARRHTERGISALSLRGTLLATAITMALPSSARADSAIGDETATGNQLNPTGQILHLAPDPLGLSSYFENSRSPTGLLYMRPLLYPEMVQSKSDPDWWSSAWGEAGWLGMAGKTGTASF